MELKKSRIKYKGRRYEQPISAATDLGSKIAIAFPAREDEVSGKIIELPKIDLGGRVCPVPEDVRKLVSISVKSKNVLLAVTQSKFLLFTQQGKRKATASHQNFQKNLHCVWDSVGEVLYATSGRYSVTCWNFGFGLNSINMGAEIVACKFEVIGLSVNHYRQLAILGSECIIAVDLINHRKKEVIKLHNYQMNKIETTGDRWITSSLDGTIKIWDLDWQLIDTMVSHQHEIIAICSMTVSSGTELVFSQSLDGRIICWSLEGAEVVMDEYLPEAPQFERRQVGYSAGMLARSDQSLLSYGEYGLYDYHINLLYSKLHQFDAPVRRIELGVPTLSEYSGSGNVLAVQVGDSEIILISTLGLVINRVKVTGPIEDFTYQKHLELLHVLVAGSIEIYGVAAFERPAPLLSTFQPSGSRDVKSVEVYTPDNDFLIPDWNNLCNSQRSLNRWNARSASVCFAGLSTGEVISYDPKTGQELFATEAVSNSIKRLRSGRNSSVLAVLSTTGELIFLRIYASTTECLEPISRDNIEDAQLVELINGCPLVVVNSPETMEFSVRKSGPGALSMIDPLEQHADHVTSLCTTADLNFAVSASLDGIIKVWSERGDLRQTADLNRPIGSLSFAGGSGDLIVAFQNSTELQIVNARDYLPEDYLKNTLIRRLGKVEQADPKMTIRTSDESEEEEVEEIEDEDADEEEKNILRRNRDIDRIKAARMEIEKSEFSNSEREHIERVAFDKYMRVAFGERANIHIPTEEDYVNWKPPVTPPPEPDPSDEPELDGAEDPDFESNSEEPQAPASEVQSKVSVISREEGAPVPAGMGRAISATSNTAVSKTLLPNSTFRSSIPDLESLDEDGKWKRPEYNFSSLTSLPTQEEEEEFVPIALRTETAPTPPLVQKSILLQQMEAAISLEQEKEDEAQAAIKQAEIEEKERLEKEAELKAQKEATASRNMKPKNFAVREHARRVPFSLAPALPPPGNSVIHEPERVFAVLAFSTQSESGPLVLPSVIPLEVSAEPEIAEEVSVPKAERYKPSKFVTPKAPTVQKSSPLPPLEALVLDSDELTVEDLSRPSTRQTARSKATTARTPRLVTWPGLGQFEHHSWYPALLASFEDGTVVTNEFDFYTELVKLLGTLTNAEIFSDLVDFLLDAKTEKTIAAFHVDLSNQLIYARLDRTLWNVEKGIVSSSMRWLHIVDRESTRYGNIFLRRLHLDISESRFELLQKIDVEDEDNVIIKKVDALANPQAIKRFVESWCAKAINADYGKGTWIDGLRLFVLMKSEKAPMSAPPVIQTQQKDEQKTYKSKNIEENIVMLPRRKIRRVLPPLMTEINERGEPNITRVTVPRSKIILAPFGSFWESHKPGSTSRALPLDAAPINVPPPPIYYPDEVDFAEPSLVDRMQKFFFLQNSIYVDDVYM